MWGKLLAAVIGMVFVVLMGLSSPKVAHAAPGSNSPTTTREFTLDADFNQDADQGVRQNQALGCQHRFVDCCGHGVYTVK